MTQPPGSDPNDPQYGTPPHQPPNQPPSDYRPGYQGQPPYQGRQWTPPSPNGPALSEGDQRQWSMIAHLGGVLAIVPVLPLLPALLIYAVYGARGEFLRDQSREALNFQITVLIAYFVARVLESLPFFPSVTLLVWAFSLVFSIIAAMAANRGQRYRYPVTFRFVN